MPANELRDQREAGVACAWSPHGHDTGCMPFNAPPVLEPRVLRQLCCRVAMSHLPRLLRERAALAEALRSNQQQRKRLRKAVSEKGTPSRGAIEIAFAILLLTNGNVEAARAYAHHHDLDVEGVLSSSTSKFLEMDLEALASEQQAAADANQGTSRHAKAFLAELELAHWIQDLNKQYGLAPRASEVFERAQQLGLSRSSGAFGGAQSIKKRARQWTQRFRGRWHARMGKVKTQACGDAATVARKVLRLEIRFFATTRTKTGPFFGPSLRTSFWGRNHKRYKKEVHFWDSVFDPPNVVLELAMTQFPRLPPVGNCGTTSKPGQQRTGSKLCASTSMKLASAGVETNVVLCSPKHNTGKRCC